MMSMKIFSLEVAAVRSPTKPKTKFTVPWESIVVTEKLDNIKKAFYVIKETKKINVPRLQKDHRELTIVCNLKSRKFFGKIRTW